MAAVIALACLLLALTGVVVGSNIQNVQGTQARVKHLLASVGIMVVGVMGLLCLAVRGCL